VLGRNPDHVVGADSAFVMNRSLPMKVSPEGYLETVPELIVEFRSKNDTSAEISEKNADYLQSGARLVWLLDPDTETAVEHRPNTQPKTHRRSDTLTCDDIIPGFQLSAAELFRP
jgi:Uma2 family endonuclease